MAVGTESAREVIAKLGMLPRKNAAVSLEHLFGTFQQQFFWFLALRMFRCVVPDAGCEVLLEFLRPQSRRYVEQKQSLCLTRGRYLSDVVGNPVPTLLNVFTTQRSSKFEHVPPRVL